jgi:tRNA(Glu) U13 pseudouridine synthase TruD
MYFNEYVMMRWEKGLQNLQGDILIDRYYAEGAKLGTGIPTGPLLGWDLLLPEKGTKARIREDQLIEFAEFDEQVAKKCQEYHLRGIRRPLWVFVSDLEWSFEGDDVVLHFSLPTGSYATVLLAFVLEGVDRLTLKDNRLEIPRIEK